MNVQKDFIEEQDCNHSDLSAPSLNEVFHGKMSREIAVKVLEADGRNNVYLFRKRINPENPKDYTEYILSFLSNHEDNHFIIKQTDNLFIFANRNFTNIKCLISHYMQLNITERSCLEHGVICNEIMAMRDSLLSKKCYLAEKIPDDQLIDMFRNDGPGSYLFRPRANDSTQYVLMLFDGYSIHKVLMDIRMVILEADTNNNDNDTNVASEPKNSQPIVRIVLGENYFLNWEEVVAHFSVNPIVRLVHNRATESKLVRPIPVNVTDDIIEGDIYRQLKFSNVDNQDKSISIHGYLQYYESCKRKWRDGYGYINKKVLYIKKANGEFTIALSECSFIPINYSVFNKYCFMLCGKDKQYYIAMVKPPATPNFDNIFTDIIYSYSKSPIELDKKVYHSTELEGSTFDELTCRSYDRWVMEVKRYCNNTKDDMANEDNPERHCKLHRYCRRAKLLIEHNSGPEILLTESDTAACSTGVISSSSVNGSWGKVASNGQFEVMYKSIMLAIFPRRTDTYNTQIRILQDLPYDIDDISIQFRKVVRKKEYIIKLDQYKKVHQDLVPNSDKMSSETSPCPSKTSQLSPNLSKQPNSQQHTAPTSPVSLMLPPLQSAYLTNQIIVDSPSITNPEICPDPVSTSSISDQQSSVSCNASVIYTELIILPVTFYRTFSKHMMDNMNEIFTNNFFMTCLANAVQQEEYKRLYDYFLHMSVYWKKQIEFVFIIVKYGIDEVAQQPENLFRSNSNSNRLLINYMKLFSNDWMLRSLSKLVTEIYNSKDLLYTHTANSTVTTDTNNCAATNSNTALSSVPATCATTNNVIGAAPTNENSGVMGFIDGGSFSIEHYLPDLFKSCLEATLDGITGNITHCPATLRQIFYLTQQELISRYPNSFSQQYDPLTRANTSDRSLAIQYIIITNVVILRFFNPVLFSSNAKIEELFKNISKFLQQNTADFPKELQLDIISQLMREISKRIQSCFSVIKVSNENETVKKSIEEYRAKYLNGFNENLHKNMPQDEINSRLEEEFNTVFVNSLSRSFNDIFEFIVQLKLEPMLFYDSNNYSRQSNISQLGPDQLPDKVRAEYEKLFNEKLLNAIDAINKKKSGS